MKIDIIPITNMQDTNKVAQNKEKKLILSRLANARSGNVIDADTAIKCIRKKYGL